MFHIDIAAQLPVTCSQSVCRLSPHFAAEEDAHYEIKAEAGYKALFLDDDPKDLKMFECF